MSRKNAHLSSDKVFLIYVAMILAFGLVMLTSASAPVGYERFNDAYYFIKNQIFKGVIPGIILLIIASKIYYDKWRQYSWWFYGFSLLLLVLVFIPGIGFELNGAHSWVDLGLIGFQPAELAKLAVIIMGAFLLSDKRRDLSDWQTGLLPILVILLIPCLLILVQPDLGTLSILGVIIFGMLYLARVPKIYLIVLGLLGIIAVAIMVFAAPYRMQRFTTFLHPELDPGGVGYHINQSFLAIGSGGWYGLGVGHSRQKFQYLPEVTADSIFAVVAEEIGFIFSSLIIVLILILGWRGLKVAKCAPDDFSRLVVGGVIIWIVWQSFLNIGAIIGIMPLTGVPLPFVSHGGSALSSLLLAVGIVLNISKQAKIN